MEVRQWNWYLLCECMCMCLRSQCTNSSNHLWWGSSFLSVAFWLLFVVVMSGQGDDQKSHSCKVPRWPVWKSELELGCFIWSRFVSLKGFFLSQSGHMHKPPAGFLTLLTGFFAWLAAPTKDTTREDTISIKCWWLWHWKFSSMISSSWTEINLHDVCKFITFRLDKVRMTQSVLVLENEVG